MIFRSKLNQNFSDTETNTKNIATVSSELSTTKNDLSTLSTTVSNVSKDLSTTKTDFNNRITTLNNKIDNKQSYEPAPTDTISRFVRNSSFVNDLEYSIWYDEFNIPLSVSVSKNISQIRLCKRGGGYEQFCDFLIKSNSNSIYYASNYQSVCNSTDGPKTKQSVPFYIFCRNSPVITSITGGPRLLTNSSGTITEDNGIAMWFAGTSFGSNNALYLNSVRLITNGSYYELHVKLISSVQQLYSGVEFDGYVWYS